MSFVVHKTRLITFTLKSYRAKRSKLFVLECLRFTNSFLATRLSFAKSFCSLPTSPSVLDFSTHFQSLHTSLAERSHTTTRSTNMAIYEKLECCITVDGEDLDEYDCPPDHDASVINDESFVGPVVERYIESQPDRNFVIETRVGAEFNFRKRNCLVVDYHIDGSKMEDRVFKATAMPFARPSLDFAKGKRTVINGQQTLLRYRFSKLNAGKSLTVYPDTVHLLTSDLDGPETQTDPKTSARLGTIVVKFTRANCRPSQVSSKSSAHISKPNFSEKQSKGRTMDTFTSLVNKLPASVVSNTDTSSASMSPLRFL